MSSFLVFLEFLKTKHRGEGTEQQQTYQFTQGYNILHRLQVHHLTSLVPRPSYHGVPVRGPGNSGLRMRLIKTARYA